MKRRYLYSVLVGVPGFVLSLLLMYMLFGVAGGVLWILVYRDNAWPAWSATVVPVIFAIDVLAVWIPFPLIGFSIGKRLEQGPRLNKIHVLISVGLTILFIVFSASYRVRIPFVGP
jgi:hypothetical protein